MSSSSSKGDWFDQKFAQLEERQKELVARLDYLEEYLESITNNNELPWEEEELRESMDESEHGEAEAH